MVIGRMSKTAVLRQSQSLMKKIVVDRVEKVWSLGEEKSGTDFRKKRKDQRQGNEP